MPPDTFFDAEELLRRLRDPRPALRGIGALLAAQGQRAFLEKRLGSFGWPTRYPGQDEPFLNVAAALRDLNLGRPVRQRRLDREPVLRDEGELFRSLNFLVTGSTRVEAGVFGAAAQYADTHQAGRESRQRVTQTARETLTRQRRRARGRMREALKKLGFIYSVDEVVTKVARRPFVGVTERTERDIRRTVELFLSETEGVEPGGGR